MFFNAGVGLESQAALEEILGFRKVNSFKRYLGMPTMVGRSKKPIFAFLRDRLHKIILGWKERFLSKAGREVLINSIAQSIPTYIMSCFALPISFCNEMRSIISKFGGAAKQARKFLQNPNSLCARVLKAKYHPNMGFAQAGPRRRASFIWQSIMKGKRVLDSGFAWRIGNGEFVKALEDNWITSATFMQPVGKSNVTTDSLVSYFIDNGRWDEVKLSNSFLPTDVANIIKIPLSRRLPPDKLFWFPNKNGYYSVKSGYYQACKLLNRNQASSSTQTTGSDIWGKIWRCPVPPKVRHFLW
ncbi:uncharacterized protein LOC126656959 [Mercurialis annua]|uniref:uncharacterized protein LOC126656959 n=1 Tax=Mercurialis annua TaxID=3986 RepID=UPI00215E4788|nr:uncharacterized protein LOC126656959 [Mercurialis annua]